MGTVKLATTLLANMIQLYFAPIRQIGSLSNCTSLRYLLVDCAARYVLQTIGISSRNGYIVMLSPVLMNGTITTGCASVMGHCAYKNWAVHEPS